MSNYSLVIDSTFKPFSYQELMAPVTRMSDYHEKLAQEYDTLSSQADILEAMGKDDRDKESGAYSRYKAYSDSLRKEANDLYRYGLNVESRRRLSDIRRRYNTDIVPIQNAWNKRQEEVKAQQDLMDKNPGVMFTRDANQTSIDAYIDNPMGGYQTINPDNIYKDMYTAAKNLEKQIRSGHVEGIDPYTSRYVEQYGLDPTIINEWISDPTKNPTLTAMMNQVLQKNGVTAEALQNSPNLDRIMQASTNAAQLGAWGAVGEDRGQMMENYGARLNAQAAKELSVAKAKAAMADSGNSGYVFNDSIYDLPMQSAGKDTKATVRSVRSLNYNKDDWNPNSKNYMVNEIKGYKDNKPIYSTEQISLRDLINRQDSSKKDINVSSYWSDKEGEEGLILATTEDGKAHRYFISADNMPESNIVAARNYFSWAKTYKDAGMTAEARKATQLAMQALHTGLTVHNNNYEQNLVRQPSLKQSGQVD